MIKGYKSANNYIIELLIQKNANNTLTNNTTDKYRTEKAFVNNIYNKFNINETLDFISSDYDNNFIYKKGEVVCVDNFDTDLNKTCTTGIHFYLDNESAFKRNLGKFTYDLNDDSIVKNWQESELLF